MKKTLVSILLFPSLIITGLSYAQYQKVHFIQSDKEAKIEVWIGGKPFTNFIYPDSLEKPILYPLLSAYNDTVTRRFPLLPGDGEKVDHPHHTGLWFNYESVNGLDFWNNSYNIPASKKAHYGWIKNVQVNSVRDGKDSGILKYAARWVNQSGQLLLKESTRFVFRGKGEGRIIERVTTLTADKDTVYFKDVKDGLLAIRVAKELEMPSEKVEMLIDKNGNRYKAAVKGAAGQYLSSSGKQGDAVWGTRGSWCLLSGKMQDRAVAIAIIDHPQNPGYPAYWHARGYGLFAVNPLGQSVFSNGKEHLNLMLAPGQSVTFRYQVVIQAGELMTAEKVTALAADFGGK